MNGSFALLRYMQLTALPPFPTTICVSVLTDSDDIRWRAVLAGHVRWHRVDMLYGRCGWRSLACVWFSSAYVRYTWRVWAVLAVCVAFATRRVSLWCCRACLQHRAWAKRDWFILGCFCPGCGNGAFPAFQTAPYWCLSPIHRGSCLGLVRVTILYQT